MSDNSNTVASNPRLGEQPDGSFIFPADRLADLQDRIAKLNRRASKLAVGGMNLLVLETILYNYIDRLGNPMVKPLAHVRIDGLVPTVSGWRLLARIEHLDEGNVVSKAPRCTDRELPEHFRNCAPTCEHCNLFRRRNDTFVLENAQGEMKRVGRNCLADFLKSADDVAGALRLWDLLGKVRSLIMGECDEDMFYSGSSKGYMSTLAYLALTVAAIREYGWVSRKESYDTGRSATADIVLSATKLAPTEEDVGNAEAVYDWAQTLGDREHLSDYLSNLRVACAQGYITQRLAGIVASAVPAYNREQADKQAALRVGNSQHVGQVKQRLTLSDLLVERVYVTENMYGLATWVTMSDKDGNVYCWKASGSVDFKVGDRVSGKGTVKGHDDYKGTKQTTLTRCALTVQA